MGEREEAAQLASCPLKHAIHNTAKEKKKKKTARGAAHAHRERHKEADEEDSHSVRIWMGRFEPQPCDGSANFAHHQEHVRSDEAAVSDSLGKERGKKPIVIIRKIEGQKKN